MYPTNSPPLGSVTFDLKFDQTAEPEPAVWFGVQRICQRTGLSRTLTGLESAGDNCRISVQHVKTTLATVVYTPTCACIHTRWRGGTLGLVEKLKGGVLPSMILKYLNHRPVLSRRFPPCCSLLVAQHRYKLQNHQKSKIWTLRRNRKTYKLVVKVKCCKYRLSSLATQRAQSDKTARV